MQNNTVEFNCLPYGNPDNPDGYAWKMEDTSEEDAVFKMKMPYDEVEGVFEEVEKYMDPQEAFDRYYEQGL